MVLSNWYCQWCCPWFPLMVDGPIRLVGPTFVKQLGLTIVLHVIFIGISSLIPRDYLVITSRKHEDTWLWNPAIREYANSSAYSEINQLETQNAGRSLFLARLLRNSVSILGAVLLLFVTTASETTRAIVERGLPALSTSVLLRDDLVSLQVPGERNVSAPAVGRAAASRRMRAQRMAAAELKRGARSVAVAPIRIGT